MKPIISLLTLVLLLAATGPIQAENSTHADGYVVHHNAFKADFLSPDIATQYGIQRSKYRGVLNVSVIREEAGTTGVPVAADIEVTASDLTGRLIDIELRQVREQEAIYYIDDFPVVDGERVRFRVEVTPEGADRVIDARFEQEFYVD